MVPSDGPAIVLTTLNAKYIHASLGLRYLLANMGALKRQTVLREFTIARKVPEVAAELLATLGEPLPGVVQIIGFGVYIWNVTQTTEVVRLLKNQRPEVKVVLGGPEVSHELGEQEIVRLADHVITGWGDVSFPKLCRALLHGSQPLMKIIAGEEPPLDQLVLPYAEYTDADLAHRLLYVEASRGCPFKCEFCLSSLDKTSRAFDLDAFLDEMQGLYRRGARNFKFVDRTFNLKVDSSVRILQFFLDRLPAPDALGNEIFVHFEVVPDHLPDRLKVLIAKFPPGVLQLEVGVQSFSIAVQQRVSRKQDNAKTEANLRWLVAQSNAHLHADLIFGLPGETLESFATGFDRLQGLGPHEIQLGILKRLRGTPIVRHSTPYGMVYDPDPPYTVRQTGAVDAATLQRFARFSRYWDMIANSGRFTRTLLVLLAGPSPFYFFLDFADWQWLKSGTTSGLTPEALVDAMFDYLCTQRGLPALTVQQALLADYVASGARASPQALKGLLPEREAPQLLGAKTLADRQVRHLAVRQTAD
ncbi:DUF4080 domain-containing protein [Rhodoferax ferrireducens]|uniref:B12-binding domain-containing radical SAM protein n=1 Tax=Rhodoferax ferrireducens TaxID=192843 RepID=UPI00298D809A|nr:DUF4080 domain-containing protein [Rhodoferax ferrireducens]WPC67913.1 DUF4080 domain-containing protein [Rhodoferax ferrireducens]